MTAAGVEDAWGPWLRDQGVERELIRDKPRAWQVLQELRDHRGDVAFDLETAARPGGTALDPERGYARLAQFYCDGPLVYVFDLPVLGGLRILEPLIERPLVTFAGVFECKWLLAAGLEFSRLDDAALAAGLHFERDQARRGDLITVARLRCKGLGLPPMQGKKEMQLSDFSQEPLTAEQIAYAASDPVITLRLWRALDSEVSAASCAYAAARGAIVATARMELQGLPFDRQAHRWIADEWGKLKKIEDARFTALTADWVKAKALEFPKDKRFAGKEGLLPSQRQTFGEFLIDRLAGTEALVVWPRTDTGRLQLSGKRLKALGLADASPEVVQYLRANGLSALVSTFGHPLADLLHPLSGRLHFRLRIAGARTGRYTSSEPNGQNMPTGPFRRVFAARPGRLMLSCDYAAVELRIAALLAQEESLFEVFREPPLLEDGSRNPAGDPHVQIARQLSLPADPKLRLAKALNYGTIYGISTRGFAIYAGIEETDAAEHLSSWATLRRSLVNWQRRTNELTKRTSRSRTTLGRIVNCLIPEKRRKGKQVSPPRISLQRGLNVPVQGGAAEAILLAIAKVDADLAAGRGQQETFDAHLCVTVHDELVIEAAEKDADLAANILENGMRWGFERVFGHMPDFESVARYIVGGVTRGETWGGPRLDPAALSAADKEALFKGLEEIVEESGDEDDDEDDLPMVRPQVGELEPGRLASPSPT
jgi:DNA polymerase-1